MRILTAFLLLFLPGCGADLVGDSTPTPRVTALALTPPTDTVPPLGEVQFELQTVWSDGVVRPAVTTFAATAGEITPTGLFRAGAEPGDVRVIASCSCGLADTAVVHIVAPPAAPSLAILTLEITGLPISGSASVLVTGPAGFSRLLTAGALLDSLPAGLYQVQASGVTVGTTVYAPSLASQSVTLVPGGTMTLSLRYAETGLPAHPRVWMTPERVAHLQAQATAGTTRWLRVRSIADAQVARGTAFTSGDEAMVPSLCLSYLATRDVRYAQRAGSILTQYAVESNDLKRDSGYDFRFNLPLVSMGLDWCYDGLSTAQRQQVATWLMNRADWVWPETNPARVGGWGTADPANNYYWGFMMTGPAALAADGDDTGQGTVSGGNRPAYHRQLALTKWNSLAVPFFAGPGNGGAWAEGTNYESTWRVSSFADGFLTSGIRLAIPFFEQSVLWRFHSTMPGGVYKAPLGDQPRVSTAPTFTYDRMSMFYALPLVNASSTLASQAQYWLNLIGQPSTSEFSVAATLADELLRYQPNQAAAPDLSGLPKHYLAPGPGFFIYRTSWTAPTATVMVFESGPVGDHGARDANGLMIWKGDFWVTATANIYSHSGIEGATVNYNNMTVGGAGQVLYYGNGGTIPVAPQVSDELVVVRGQAKLGYGYPAGVSIGRSVVSDYLRTVAYVPSLDAFVIVDRATAVNPAADRVWRWHTKGSPDITGNEFRLRSPSGAYSCFGSVLLPAAAQLGRDTFSLGSNPGISSYAVTVTVPTSAGAVVVTVLQCTSGASAPFTPTATVDASEAVVTIGPRRVTVPLNETVAVRLQ